MRQTLVAILGCSLLWGGDALAGAALCSTLDDADKPVFVFHADGFSNGFAADRIARHQLRVLLDEQRNKTSSTKPKKRYPNCRSSGDHVQGHFAILRYVDDKQKKETIAFGYGASAADAEKDAVDELGRRNWSWRKRMGYETLQAGTFGMQPTLAPIPQEACPALVRFRDEVLPQQLDKQLARFKKRRNAHKVLALYKQLDKEIADLENDGRTEKKVHLVLSLTEKAADKAIEVYALTTGHGKGLSKAYDFAKCTAKWTRALYDKAPDNGLRSAGKCYGEAAVGVFVEKQGKTLNAIHDGAKIMKGAYGLRDVGDGDAAYTSLLRQLKTQAQKVQAHLQTYQTHVDEAQASSSEILRMNNLAQHIAAECSGAPTSTSLD